MSLLALVMAYREREKRHIYMPEQKMAFKECNGNGNIKKLEKEEVNEGYAGNPGKEKKETESNQKTKRKSND